MDHSDFEQTFAVFYFSIAAYAQTMGIVVFGGESRFGELIGRISLQDDQYMIVTADQLQLFKNATSHVRQKIFDEVLNTKKKGP